MTAKIEPWIECAVWEIDSRCLETGAFFNRNQAANIIAAHAPKQVKVQELSITVDQIQQAIDYGFTISGLEQELTKLIHAAEQADE